MFLKTVNQKWALRIIAKSICKNHSLKISFFITCKNHCLLITYVTFTAVFTPFRSGNVK